MPAVFCLLTSLLPPFAPYSLILGFVGLRQIARSGGRKCGRGIGAGLLAKASRMYSAARRDAPPWATRAARPDR